MISSSLVKVQLMEQQQVQTRGNSELEHKIIEILNAHKEHKKFFIGDLELFNFIVLLVQSSFLYVEKKITNFKKFIDKHKLWSLDIFRKFISIFVWLDLVDLKHIFVLVALPCIFFSQILLTFKQLWDFDGQNVEKLKIFSGFLGDQAEFLWQLTTHLWKEKGELIFEKFYISFFFSWY